MCQSFGILGTYAILSSAVSYNLHFFDVTQYMPIFIGAITGAVYTMKTAPEPEPIQTG